MSRVIYIQLVEWSPFRSITDAPSLERFAVVSPELCPRVIPGKAVPGMGGMTRGGFVERVVYLSVPEAVMMPIFAHAKDDILNVVITHRPNGVKYLSVQSDAGSIIGPLQIDASFFSASPGEYPTELHVRDEWIDQ